MSLNLMTGYAGEPHITSADDGAVNAAIYGAEKYVLNTGQKFAYELISNNLIKIKDGYAMNQGRKIGQAVNNYEELTIDNGLQGVKRSDIIAIRYSKNIDTGIESAEFVVIKGTSGDDYKDPACQTGNIIQGDSVDDFPLYRIKIDGLNIVAVEPMFDVLVSMEELQNKYNDILGSQDISKIGDGTVTGAIDSLNSNTLKMPDYSKRYAILNGGGTYSITKYGFVQLDCRNGDTNSNKSLCRLFINGVQIDQTSGPPSADSKWVYYTSPLYPVSPGDSVQITAASWSDQNITYFYPLL